MGGNALKNTKTRRYSKEEYLRVANEVVSRMVAMGVQCEAIKSYTDKETHGDLDVLVLQTNNLKNLVETKFKPKEMVVNGPVISFNYEELQVDFIQSSPEEYDFAKCYYAFNDLGNLLGRVAHKLGMKLGHDCLNYVLRDGTQVIGNIPVSRDWAEALRLIGYEPKRYFEGFETLKDIFDFVTTSKFFDPNIYLLNNRNAESRIRDKKRDSYMKFLKYCETLETCETRVSVTKDKYLFYLLNDAKFHRTYTDLIAENNRKKVVRAKFNGDIIGAITGFEGKKLGAYMEFIRQNYAIESMSPTQIKELAVSALLEFKFVADENHRKRNPDVEQPTTTIPPEIEVTTVAPTTTAPPVADVTTTAPPVDETSKT